MGKPPFKINLSPDNYYVRSSEFRINELHNHHEVFVQRKIEAEAKVPYDIETPLVDMHKRQSPEKVQSPTSSLMKTKDEIGSNF